MDEPPLREIIELGKDIEIPIWEYSGKFYLKFNAKKVYEYSIGLMSGSDGSEVTQLILKKPVPYIMDFTFTKYDLEKNQEHIKVYTFCKH